MSGGSFNYLCWKDAQELVHAGQDDLEAMATYLAKIGYAQDAATETEELLRLVRVFLMRLDVRVRALSEVWHAVEWNVSGDSGPDHIREALADYRKADHG